MQKAGWYYGNGAAGTIKEMLPVGQLLPNAWGLFDTHGNVWEYCLDWYEEYKPGSTTDPTGPVSGIRRVMRGGCFGILAEYCGSAYSDEYDPTMTGSGIGFRVALAIRDE
jgi:formylglycine-generating enzyme required for sulfatase activity